MATLLRAFITSSRFTYRTTRLFTHSRTMSSEKIITAYSVAVPEKQTQKLPGLDKDIKRQYNTHLSSYCV